MPKTLNSPITQADVDALAALFNAKLLPLVNADIAADATPWGSWLLDGGNITSFSGRNIYARPAALTDGPQTIKNPQPAYDFSTGANNWMSELNRIRGDYYQCINQVIAGASGVYKNRNNLVSGPWIVGVNDLNTFADRWYLAGGAASGLVYDSNGQCVIPISDYRVNPLGLERFIMWYPPGYQPGLPTDTTWTYPDTSITIGDTTYDALSAFKPLPLKGATSVTLNGVAGQPVIAPVYLLTMPGVLWGATEAKDYPTTGPAFTIFRTVSFYTTDVRAVIWSAMGDGSRVSLAFDTTNTGYDYTSVITFATDVAGTLKAQVKFTITLTGSTPDPSALALVSSLGNLTVSSSTSGVYDVVIDLDQALPTGSTDLSITFTVPSTTTAVAVGDAGLTPVFIYATHDSPVETNAITPASAAYRIDCGDEVPPVFTLANASTTIYPCACWLLNDPTIKGCWSAMTLPVPGRNVYLDQDFPPFVGLMYDSAADLPVVNGVHQHEFFAVSEYIPGPDDTDYGSWVMASRMRQKVALLAPREDLPPDVAALLPWVPSSKFGIVQSALEARPAPFPILRDTDFVPYLLGNYTDFGWGEDYRLNVTLNNGELHYDGVTVVDTATKVKVRCVASGTLLKGWKNGVLQYGEPLATTFNIYVKKDGSPTTTDYDFKVTSNSLDIDPDGGGSYLATVRGTGFYYAIENVSGGPVTFDLYVETYLKDEAAVRRQFFPPARECFSHSLTGEPAILRQKYISSGTNNQYSRRMIPQNGYCIFKVRATRLPVTNAAGLAVIPTSGPELVITLGQNRLNDDGTLTFVPLPIANGGIGAGDTDTGAGDTDSGAGGVVGDAITITIPATAGTSGDVAFFLPVLDGNELVYHCDSPVVFEAWADWQPIFFQSTLGVGNAYPYDGGANAPTSFQYALAFMNKVDVALSGYSAGSSGNYTADVVQYPMSIEIYNDLEACLNLLP